MAGTGNGIKMITDEANKPHFIAMSGSYAILDEHLKQAWIEAARQEVA